MSKLVNAFIIIFFTLLVLIKYSYANPPVTILLFGDSIIAGYGLAESEVLSERMKTMFSDKKLSVNVINAGISGETTSDGLNRLPATLASNKADIVLLALGGNDMLRSVAPSIVKNNLDAMLKILTEHKVKIIFSAVEAPINRGLTYRNEFNSIFPELAKKYDIKLYPFLIKETYGKSGLMQTDFIHPSARGIEVIAKGLVEFCIDELF